MFTIGLGLWCLTPLSGTEVDVSHYSNTHDNISLMVWRRYHDNLVSGDMNTFLINLTIYPSPEHIQYYINIVSYSLLKTNNKR